VSNPRTKPAPKAKPKAPQYKGGKRVSSSGSSRGFWIIGAVVLVIGIAAVVAVAAGSKSSSKPTSGKAGDTAVSAAVMKQITTVPSSVFETVGAGTAAPLPQKLSAPVLTQDGKPRVVYIGAEYCPYCATERWAVVTALSRFGTFTGLKQTHSADSPEVFPDTETFSFHGSTYTSKYLVFSPVETETNTHAALDTPTAEESQLLQKYDVPPYSGSDSSSAGAIPFIYIGGKYISIGATFDPTVLQGKSASEIAAALHDPTSAIGKGAIGAANGLTAAICGATGNQPAAVCSSSAIQQIQSKIG
jgi:Domain of unknown function (DUF929)